MFTFVSLRALLACTKRDTYERTLSQNKENCVNARFWDDREQLREKEINTIRFPLVINSVEAAVGIGQGDLEEKKYQIPADGV